MSRRNWGLPTKDGPLRQARDSKPVLTLSVTMVFGIIATAFAAMSFSMARGGAPGFFQGWTGGGAIIAAGFGAWVYIFISMPRFAAKFAGGDGFSVLLWFYARATLAICLCFAGAHVLLANGPASLAAMAFCVAGGAAAAAAFQTVMTFVPVEAAGD